MIEFGKISTGAYSSEFPVDRLGQISVGTDLAEFQHGPMQLNLVQFWSGPTLPNFG